MAIEVTINQLKCRRSTSDPWEGLLLNVFSPKSITPPAAFAIPAEGSSVSYNMPGITSKHVLTKWNFSSSDENNSPVDIYWTTYNGYFTISNNGGTTSETIKPVFELPTEVSITSR